VNPKVKDRSQVWVWIEHHHDKLARVSLGLLGKARELCQQLNDAELASVLAGTDSKQLVAELIDHGSDKVYLASNPSFTPFQTDLCANLMTRLIQSHRPEIVLSGATSLGQETAARVAARVGTGLTAHCIDLYIEKINEKPQLVTVVAGWGGNLTLKIICPEKRPQMATVKPGILSPAEPEKRSGEVITVEPEDKAPTFEVVEVVEEQEETLPLERAEVVVAAGWGLNSSGGFQAAEELAEILGGVVAGTRPVLDAGWIPIDRMIGQSGETVAPQLLVTLGVSGAPQFATGVLNSKVIFAVDKNPQAPIFEMADIGIVGDLQDVLPLLIKKLRAIKRQS
jgi:electron transfer flavoprotein alpha subunit